MDKNKFNVSWLNETVERMPDGGQGFYKLLCVLMLKKRLTYQNLYVFACTLNKHKYKNNETYMKQLIIEELAGLYFYNNGKLPSGFVFKLNKSDE